MHWLNNISVKSKFKFFICLMLIISALIGATGILGLLQTNKLDEELYEGQTEPIVTISNLIENLLIASSSFDMAILSSDDPDSVEAYREDVERLNQESQALIEQYSSSVPPQAQEAFDNGAQIFAEVFVPTSPEVFALLQDGDVEGADATMGGIDVKIGEMVEDFNTCKTANVENAQIKRDQNAALSQTLTLVQALIFAGGVVVVILVGLMITKSISRPMKTLTDMARHVGETGDLTAPPEMESAMEESAKRADEFGKTTRAFSEMFAMFSEKAELLNKVAQCDLSDDVELKSEHDVIGLSLKEMTGNLNSIFKEMRAAADQVADGSLQIAQGAQVLASGSSQQSASVQEFSASIAEVLNQVENNASSATKSLEVTNHAGELMGSAMAYMNNMLEAMQSIDESSQSIKKVIKVIDDIAFQTNILALNAAVEAARAGQHGKGFAVVAEEVRNLASKSAEAAKETASLIEGSTERVSEGNQIVANTKTSLEDVGASAMENLGLIKTIVDASSEQTRTITELNNGMGQISTVVQTNSASAEESASAAQEISAQAALLKQLVAKFKLRS